MGDRSSTPSEEGARFAKVMGADSARVLVMVATAAVGSGLSQFLKVLPSLPGAGPASELAVAEGGVPFAQLGAVEGVTIGKGGLTISLVNGAVLATSLNGNVALGPRINLIRPSPTPQAGASSAADAVRLRKQMASEAGVAELRAGGGRAIAGAGTRAKITDLPRILAEHGGRAEDWAKVTSEVSAQMTRSSALFMRDSRSRGRVVNGDERTAPFANGESAGRASEAERNAPRWSLR